MMLNCSNQDLKLYLDTWGFPYYTSPAQLVAEVDTNLDHYGEADQLELVNSLKGEEL